jgi:translation initiation factor 3 subunit L
VGFAQLMLQDFSNAIRSLTSLIMQVHRNRNYYSRFGDFDQLNKFSDKALALIKITIYLCPGYKVNDHIHTSLREKFQDKQQKLSKGDISVLTDLFHFASPKFILLSAPINPTTSVNANQLQLQHFEQLIARQRHVTSLRSFIKLYRSIDLKKLADFLNEDAAAAAKLAVAAKASKSSKDPVEREVQEEQQEPTVEPLTTEQVRALLMAYKLNAAAYKADVHFFLSQSLVKVDEDISNQRTGEFFMNHIHKFARIVDECAVE